MIEILNNPKKKAAAAVLFFAVVAMAYFSIQRDRGKVGACVSCCTAAGAKICKPNFSKELCKEYNSRNVEGRRWQFIVTVDGKCP